MQPTDRTVPSPARGLIAGADQRNEGLCGRGPEGLQLICRPLGRPQRSSDLSWLYFGYLAVYAWLLLDGILDDVRKGHPAWYITAGVIGGTAILGLVLAFRYTSLAELLGKASALLLLLALGWDILSGYTDLRNEPRLAGVSPRRFLWVKIAGVAGVIGYSIPAYWMAFTVVRRALSAGAA